MCAQDPKATTSVLFLLSSFAISSCSDVRTAPLIIETSIPPSLIASTSCFLKSIATGQKTMSTALTTPRMSSARSTTDSSHPPHEAHQYNATFGLSGMDGLLLPGDRVSEPVHLFVPLRESLREAQRAERADPRGHVVDCGFHLFPLGGRNPFQVETVFVDPHLLHHPPEEPDPAECFVVPFHIMTVS